MKTAPKSSPTTSAHRPGADRLVELCHEHGVSLQAMSELIGKNQTYLQQFVKNRSPKEICLEGRIKLSGYFGVKITELTNDHSTLKLLAGAGVLLDKKKIEDIDSTVSLPILPLTAKGFIDFRGKGIARMNTPNFLRGVDDAYSTTMPDNTMAPVIRKGAVIYVNPSRIAAPGNEIVVKFKNQTGIIRSLVARTRQNLIVQCHNPANEFVIDLGDVESVHYIVATTRDPVG